MKIFATVMKIVAALAAIAGVVYLVATYGDKLVAWAKKTLKCCQPCCEDECCCCEEDCCCDEGCECCCEEPACEEACECCEAAEVPAEEPVEEADFEA